MNSILKSIIALAIGLIIGLSACKVLLTHAFETAKAESKANELITLTKEVINEKNYYSFSEDNMLFINETLDYNVYSCENAMFNVVLTDNNNEKYSFDFIDTQYGTYYLGINGHEYVNQDIIGSGSITIASVWTPNYSLYQNDYEYFNYKSMCENITDNLKDDLNSFTIYAINSFPWDKSEQGKSILLIHENEAIITYAVQSSNGYILDKMNYSISKFEYEDLIYKFKQNSVGFSVKS